jgi:hypothetical protein
MKLSEIQSAIKAPKGQFNSFGKYKYRSCEDIVEAVKPVINSHGFYLTLSDDIIEVSGRVYVKATATITDGKETYSTTAFAREEDQKKGMDAAQVTGAASSYARKYALNGLFAIDDTQDADATNNHKEEPKANETKKSLPLISEESFKKATELAAKDKTIYTKTLQKYSLTARQDELLFDACKN